MGAVPGEFIRRTAHPPAEATRPYPSSRKILIPGPQPDIQVGKREVQQSATPGLHGGEANPPVPVYDTSGPYTDPAARVDLLRCLVALRAHWNGGRQDTDALPDFSAQYTRFRNANPALGGVRFPVPREAGRQCHPDALCPGRKDHTGVGRNFLVKINANIGNSTVTPSIAEEAEKMVWLARWG